MAALIIAKDPAKYGFVGIKYHEPIPYETVRVAPQKNLRDIARVIGVSQARLIELNPALIHAATPPGAPYPIHVPVGYAAIATQKNQQIASLKNVSPQIAKRSSTYRHKVRRGDTLGGIARKYGSSVSKIKRANGLKSSTIRIGQRLKIPGRYATVSSKSSQHATSTVKYRVKSGDTLGAIAARHRVSTSDVRRANNIKGSLIKTGQVLTIPGASGRYYGDDTSARKTTKIAKYKVKSGDTLGGIAAKHGVSITTIRRANGIKGSNIRAGQTLKIPHITTTARASSGSSSTKAKSNGSYKYRVRSGDTLGGIAQKHGVRVSSLKRANNISGSKIRSGQLLTIPGSNGSYSSSSSSSSSNGKPGKYKVKSGDTLGGIAQRHGVRVASLKSANNISGSTIRAGQILVIPNGSHSTKSSSNGGPLSYKVKSGDTLWGIANKHNVTVANIKKWNNLKSNSLSPGKKLTIYK